MWIDVICWNKNVKRKINLGNEIGNDIEFNIYSWILMMVEYWSKDI